MNIKQMLQIYINKTLIYPGKVYNWNEHVDVGRVNTTIKYFDDFGNDKEFEYDGSLSDIIRDVERPWVSVV